MTQRTTSTIVIIATLFVVILGGIAIVRQRSSRLDRVTNPIQQVTRPPLQQVTHPPLQQVTRPPLQQVTRPPLRQATRPPLQQVTRPPLQQVTRPPLQQVTRPPLQQVTRPSSSAVIPLTDDDVDNMVNQTKNRQDVETYLEKIKQKYNGSVMSTDIDDTENKENKMALSKIQEWSTTSPFHHFPENPVLSLTTSSIVQYVYLCIIVSYPTIFSQGPEVKWKDLRILSSSIDYLPLQKYFQENLETYTKQTWKQFMNKLIQKKLLPAEYYNYQCLDLNVDLGEYDLQYRNMTTLILLMKKRYDTKVVKAFLPSVQESIDKADVDGRSALFYSFYDPEIVTLLCQQGKANPNVQDKYDSNTTLHYWVSNWKKEIEPIYIKKSPNIVHNLLRHSTIKVDLSLKNKDGYTALLLLCRLDNLNPHVYDLLLRHDATIDIDSVLSTYNLQSRIERNYVTYFVSASSLSQDDIQSSRFLLHELETNMSFLVMEDRLEYVSILFSEFIIVHYGFYKQALWVIVRINPRKLSTATPPNFDTIIYNPKYRSMTISSNIWPRDFLQLCVSWISRFSGTQWDACEGSMSLMWTIYETQSKLLFQTYFDLSKKEMKIPLKDWTKMFTSQQKRKKQQKRIKAQTETLIIFYQNSWSFMYVYDVLKQVDTQCVLPLFIEFLKNRYLNNMTQQIRESDAPDFVKDACILYFESFFPLLLSQQYYVIYVFGYMWCRFLERMKNPSSSLSTEEIMDEIFITSFGPVMTKIFQKYLSKTSPLRNFVYEKNPPMPSSIFQHFFKNIQQKHKLTSLAVASIGQVRILSNDPTKIIKYVRPLSFLFFHQVEITHYAYLLQSVPSLSEKVKQYLQFLLGDTFAEFDVYQEANNLKTAEAIYTIHPSIRPVHVYDQYSLSLDSLPYIIMELAQGKSVQHYLTTSGSLSSDSLSKLQQSLRLLVKRWLDQVLFGNGWFHTDLHGGNMIWNDRTNELLLIDFGGFTQIQPPQLQSNLLQFLFLFEDWKKKPTSDQNLTKCISFLCTTICHIHLYDVNSILSNLKKLPNLTSLSFGELINHVFRQLDDIGDCSSGVLPTFSKAYQLLERTYQEVSKEDRSNLWQVYISQLTWLDKLTLYRKKKNIS